MLAVKIYKRKDSNIFCRTKTNLPQNKINKKTHHNKQAQQPWSKQRNKSTKKPLQHSCSTEKAHNYISLQFFSSGEAFFGSAMWYKKIRKVQHWFKRYNVHNSHVPKGLFKTSFSLSLDWILTGSRNALYELLDLAVQFNFLRKKGQLMCPEIMLQCESKCSELK